MINTSDEIIDKIRAELQELEATQVDIKGKKMLPSQCYHFNVQPAHVLFNTNCPDTLRKKVEDILKKYIPHEDRPQQ